MTRSDNDLLLALVARGLLDRDGLECARDLCRDRPERGLASLLEEHGLVAPQNLREIEAALRAPVDAGPPPEAPRLGATATPTRLARDIESLDPEIAPALHVIGDHEILSKLGEGGMGTVYLARDRRLGRKVALKMIKRDTLQGRPDAAGSVQARFFQEVRAASRLSHPSIVAVYEVGEFEGRPFFTMEYVPGRPLDGVLDEARLPQLAAARIALSLARALEHAHGSGIVHRDLKPSNVLIDEGANPRLVDFGLARRIEGGEKLTRTGAILGTPHYIAPEQVDVSFGEIGPATDVYGLGGILYHCVTGSPPNRGESEIQILYSVSTLPVVRPRKILPGLSPRLEAIVMKALDKRPSRRYPGMAEMAADLERFIAGCQTEAESNLGRYFYWIVDHRRRVGALAILLAVVLMYSVLAYRRASQAETEFDRAIARLRSEFESSPANDEPTWSWDLAIALESLTDSSDSNGPRERAAPQRTRFLRRELESTIRRAETAIGNGNTHQAQALAGLAREILGLLGSWDSLAEVEELPTQDRSTVRKLAAVLESMHAAGEGWHLEGRTILASDLEKDPGWVEHRDWFYRPEELEQLGFVVHHGRLVDPRALVADGGYVVLGSDLVPVEDAIARGAVPFQGAYVQRELLERADTFEVGERWRTIEELESEGYAYLDDLGWTLRSQAAALGRLIDRENASWTPLEMARRGYLPFRGEWRTWQDLLESRIAGDVTMNLPYPFVFDTHPVLGVIVGWSSPEKIPQEPYPE